MPETLCVFTALDRINLGIDADVQIGNGFSLLKPNPELLSARDRRDMNEREYEEAAEYSRYLVYKRASSNADDPKELRTQCTEALRRAVVAFQIIKPVQTSGFTFLGTESRSGKFSLESIYQRPPMDAGRWARMRYFDGAMLGQVPALMAKIDAVMGGAKAEPKNALYLLQLALEQTRLHVLIAGLLAVMGMEAIFDSNDKHEFKKKLCQRIGSQTLAFSDWNSATHTAPTDTAESVALPLYELRSKLAHGADLRKAVQADLLGRVQLVPEWDSRSRAEHLSEAAIYLLCQVLQTVL